jgi:hypothetical protein
MHKRAISLTLDPANLLWLRGRSAVLGTRSVSETLDDLVTAARLGGRGADAPRSVAGTIDLAPDDPALERADAVVRRLFDASIDKPARRPRR